MKRVRVSLVLKPKTAVVELSPVWPPIVSARFAISTRSAASARPPRKAASETTASFGYSPRNRIFIAETSDASFSTAVSPLLVHRESRDRHRRFFTATAVAGCAPLAVARSAPRRSVRRSGIHGGAPCQRRSSSTTVASRAEYSSPHSAVWRSNV